MDDDVKVNSILIIEDHPVVADAMRSVLSNMDNTANIIVCGTAETALAEFSKCCNWFRIFLDINIPGAHGLSLARKFANLGVAKKCAVVTASDNPQWRAEAVSMGMLGYIVKAISVEDFISALEEVLKGRPAFPKISLDEKIAVRLTRRQQDVLCLLQRGCTSKSIAAQLGLSTGTVDNHVLALLNALGVRSRAQAIAKGIELGYINFSDIS